MTPEEILLIVILAILVIFLVYYFFKGSGGRIAISRPVESRVDEYLDRKFERFVEEWSLVRRPVLNSFKEDRNAALTRDEERIVTLKKFESEMKTTLEDLEGRLNALENSLATEKTGRK
ncbi:hypothetical protein [Methanospirillum lacunae]|uniref:Uncharacterized protein n=1 Tax=Methanospirillum lacunae TaxID=668570 RepID=A0A2V2N595_9EURY|nr:hypothetical protein [Methanospirillum lacunae]PWR71377.1 hypothetical protein DK846_10955 [Methanospirillum lacunae]